ncbi:MAG: thermonuclease family protein [Xanthobacteraceae bacterium]
MRSAAPLFVLGLLGGAIAGIVGWEYFSGPVVSKRTAETAAPASPLSATGRYAVDVLRVIDGDTFEARVHVWPSFELTTRVRLRSIDAPELKARCEAERVGAETA